jgi:hypothetical protein
MLTQNLLVIAIRRMNKESKAIDVKTMTGNLVRITEPITLSCLEL